MKANKRPSGKRERITPSKVEDATANPVTAEEIGLDAARATVLAEDGCNFNFETSKNVTESFFFFGGKDVFTFLLTGFGKSFVRR